MTVHSQNVFPEQNDDDDVWGCLFICSCLFRLCSCCTGHIMSGGIFSCLVLVSLSLSLNRLPQKHWDDYADNSNNIEYIKEHTTTRSWAVFVCVVVVIIDQRTQDKTQK